MRRLVMTAWEKPRLTQISQADRSQGKSYTPNAFFNFEAHYITKSPSKVIAPNPIGVHIS